ncbi:D-alanine--D-alanine ligase [Caldinitratiruptor microaerophilus]|uniref:D-alanine--D-alanine ligase n=1 Tax=Caldinitratiruptor microaerophilus TaxID=671077 RepID=A0AA35CPJ6_9FIRM|nr:D-alanine--D-alanine ligase [Caldinitratiruptor microaerophilus]
MYLIFGGRSGEHEVSLMSARNVLEAIDKSRYEVIPVGITREGRWIRSGDPLKALLEGVERGGGIPVALLADPGVRDLVPLASPGDAAPGVSAARPSGDPPAVFFPVLHGTYGEDGTIQGLLEMAGVPYVGCGVLASAVGMDKAVAKALFAQAGLPVVPHRVFLRPRWEREPGLVAAEAEAAFGYPCFVKPANLGSSVGVSKPKSRSELEGALAEAFRFDRKVLVEAAVDAREIEVAVLGNDDPVVSVPGEVVPGREFYDYEDKYVEDRARLLIPAPLEPAQAEEARRLALAAYRCIDGAGMARVDLFLERGSGRFYVNEVNTIPGFTRISMFPKLMEASGIPYPELVDRLIQLAIERWRDRQRNAVTR